MNVWIVEAIKTEIINAYILGVYSSEKLAKDAIIQEETITGRPRRDFEIEERRIDS